MKKWKIVIVVIMISFFITGCTTTKNKTQKPNPLPTEKEEYSFYHKENQKRYEGYQEKNKDLSWKDVILRVNLGLDNPYYTNTSPSKNLNTEKLLVNKYYYLEKDYVPDHLVALDTTYSKGGIYLVEEAYIAFRKLVDAAKEEGLNIRAISAYRSYQYQVNLYERYKNQDGVEKADTYSARPGFSEHQTGLCIDVDDREKSFTDFEQTKSFSWMQENAHKYGFILRFPKEKEHITGYSYESWHYRYVGETIAKKIKEKDLTFDEYYMEYLDNEV